MAGRSAHCGTVALFTTTGAGRSAKARHAQTHDVTKEAASNSAPQTDEADEFADDLANDNKRHR